VIEIKIVINEKPDEGINIHYQDGFDLIWYNNRIKKSYLSTTSFAKDVIVVYNTMIGKIPSIC
jgi:hypothetical protein